MTELKCNVLALSRNCVWITDWQKKQLMEMVKNEDKTVFGAYLIYLDDRNRAKLIQRLLRKLDLTCECTRALTQIFRMELIDAQSKRLVE